MVKISPSLVSASSLNLEEQVRDLEQAGADMLHFDIEDGCFVPVMNLGIKTITDLRPITDLPFDVHLMMVNPEWIVPELAKRGVNRLSVHYEACEYPRRTLKLIVDHGMTAGIAFNPKTPIPNLEFCFPYLSFVVILTTEPENWSGEYLPSVLNKVRLSKPNYDNLEWVVDGGVSRENVQEIVSAGADVIVSGRNIFENNKIEENMIAIKALCQVN